MTQAINELKDHMQWLRDETEYYLRGESDESEKAYDEGYIESANTCLQWIDECDDLDKIRRYLLKRYEAIWEMQYEIVCTEKEHDHLRGQIDAMGDAVQMINPTYWDQKKEQ